MVGYLVVSISPFITKRVMKKNFYSVTVLSSLN